MPLAVVPPSLNTQGTYLLLEKLRYAVYRRLLRKVHAVHGELEPEKRTQIPLPQFQHALAMQVGSERSGGGLLIAGLLRACCVCESPPLLTGWSPAVLA